jgi:hypothetical protein
MPATDESFEAMILNLSDVHVELLLIQRDHKAIQEALAAYVRYVITTTGRHPEEILRGLSPRAMEIANGMYPR